MPIFKVKAFRLQRDTTDIFVEAPCEKALRTKLEKLELLLCYDYSLDWSNDFSYNFESNIMLDIEEEVEDTSEKIVSWDNLK